MSSEPPPQDRLWSANALRVCQDHFEHQQPLLVEAEHLAGVGSFELNPNSGEVLASEGLYRLLGLEPGTPELTREQFLNTFLHPDDRYRISEAEHLPPEQWPTQIEFRIVRTDSQVRQIHARWRLVHDASGRPSRVIGCLQDVTQQRQAEEERRLSTERQHEAQKLQSLGVLAGGLAHDFNNLLTTVLGYADLTEWQLPSESPLRVYMQHIARAARRAAELCQQLLIAAGKVPRVNVVLDLARVAREVEPRLRALLPAGVQFRLDVPPALPAVRGDTDLLRQVLVELVSNSAEAISSQAGQIAVRLASQYLGHEHLVRLQRGSDCPDGEYAVLEVSDTGCGMSEEVKSRVFEPFFTTRFTGRGLGLAAVLGIVQAHGGVMEIISEPGKGSTFRVFLPLGREG
jgi:signal transduction histidine kinase